MRMLFIAAALALSGCAGTGAIPLSPGQFTAKTTVDERSLLAAEGTYALARTALETAVDAGFGKNNPVLRAKLRDANAKAFAALQVLEAAYATANASNWIAAKLQFDIAVGQIGSLTEKK